jgi:hypothetical protein
MNFSQFSPESKVWVYPIKNTLSPDELSILEQKLVELIASWKAHGSPVSGAFEVIEKRFIVISADANCTAASGCSIDSMRKTIAQALDSVGTEISDFSSIYYQQGSNIVEVSRPKFAELKSAGEVDDQDRVFDLTPANLQTFLTRGISLPFKDSWHSKVFK